MKARRHTIWTMRHARIASRQDTIVNALDAPIDQLRYDVAFVNDAKPGEVLFVSFLNRGNGWTRGGPTHERWLSFGVKVSLPDDREQPARARTGETRAATVEAEADAWYTFRRPVMGGDLRKLTLNDYLVARDFQALPDGEAVDFEARHDAARAQRRVIRVEVKR